MITRWRSRLLRFLLVLVAVLTAYWLGGQGRSTPSHDHTAPPPPSAATIWTCSMHPQIRLPTPGQCPLCGMDLIPLVDTSGDSHDWSLEMSESARRLAEIETSPVERMHVGEEVRMVGKVEYDETRLKTVSARFGGRLDRLFVDYTGVPVKKGEHLVLLYSPTLFTAQEELLEAKRRADESHRERSEFLRGSNVRALESARQKLLLLGVSEGQIREIESRGSADAHIMITSPVSGIVANKWVKEGDYVDTGTQIYTVADLAHVWVKLDAYESNLMWIRYGQQVQIEAEAYPGEVFSGKVSFIDPVLDERTRTVKVRVNVDNANLRLKPGMFVRGIVRSTLAEGGRVMDPGLAGKQICPMHPEIVRDRAGACPVCGMPLVSAEDLGFVSSDEAGFKPLVVPVTAVLRTGKRAIAYVERLDADRPTFEGRVIELGPRASDRYIVYSGLEEGERVVTNGSFKIDSALQIQARPSMMSPPAEAPKEPAAAATTPLRPTPLDPAASRALAPVFTSYFALHEALARDDATLAVTSFATLGQSVAKVDSRQLGGALAIWREQASEIDQAVRAATAQTGIESLRSAFGRASRAVLTLERELGHPGDHEHLEVFCPMVSDGGAAWLQRGSEVDNPYFGRSMQFCGTVLRRYPGHTGGR